MAEIKINKDSTGRITVSLPYNPSYIAKIKTSTATLAPRREILESAI